ncbi:MAG: hypothetical protein M3388_01305 [Acidobacteriota bacterium]|nr:hypothetical protein [Acidobacteriota bacterium]
MQNNQTIYFGIDFAPLTDWRTFLRNAMATSAPLTIFAVVMFVSFVATMIGTFADPKIITGSAAWLKPAKFSISLGIYSLTLLWLLSYVENHRRLVKIVANVTTISAFVEIAIIIGQVFRNTTSHFNYSTPLNEMLWIIMGASIVVLWLMTLLTAILLIRQKMTDKVFALGLRLGLLVSLVGMALGFMMVSHRTAQQAALAETGQPVLTRGAHSFGVEDGGAGLPFVGWSTTGGDLRPAHFLGLHAMQILPFLGWFLSGWRKSKLNEKQRLAFLWTFGWTFLGVLTLLTWQALREQSIISPDFQTTAAFAVLIIAATLTSIRIARMRRGLT